MLKKLFLCLLICGCSTKPTEPELEPMAESADVTVTGDLSPQQWQYIPLGDNLRWNKIDEGVDTSDDAATFIRTAGLANFFESRFSIAPSPADLDVLTEMKFRFRGYWRWVFDPAGFNIQFDFYTDAGATLLGTVVVDMTAQAELVWHNYGWFSLTGLALTKAQADDVSVKLTGILPDFPDKNDQVLVSALDLRYVYTPVPTLDATSEICAGAEFLTQEDINAQFMSEQELEAMFSTQYLILGSVPVCEMLQGSTEESPDLGLTLVPPSTPEAVVEYCLSADFQAVFNLPGEFKTELEFTASVPEC